MARLLPSQNASLRWDLEPSYDELADQWWGTGAKLLGASGRPAPEIVGQAVYEAVTSGTLRVRWPVGEDAALILATRARLGDDEFESAMRSTLGLTW